MSTRAAVSIGDQVFAHEAGESFGAVRYVHPHELIVDIEGAGDVPIPGSAVRKVHDGKVIVDVTQLDTSTQGAIARAHQQETE